MPVNTSSYPKAMFGGNKMKKSPKSMSKIMKQDKAADKLMSPAMMRKDIASDKKMLAQKTKSKKGKK